jgi:light-independent protochlorophyllide reductase subunit B
VHPLMMGLEEHLIGMFREDFEFHADAAPSHLGHARHAPAAAAVAAAEAPALTEAVAIAPAAANADVLDPVWSGDAERELGKIPFFVRGKARRNTEKFATERGVATITVETLYDAKAHFGR